MDELRALLARVESAESADGLSALYRETIGYCPFKDDPTIDPARVRETLEGFILELAQSEGVDLLA